MRTLVTLPDQLHARAKQRAAELGISFAEFTRRLFERELDTQVPQGDLESICGMVHGTPFDMARDGHAIIGTAVAADLAERSG